VSFVYKLFVRWKRNIYNFGINTDRYNMEKENIIKSIAVIVSIVTILSIFIFAYNTNIKKSPNSECMTILENPKSFNVVFISYKYNDKTEFEKTAREYIYGNSGFASIEPFKSNMDKISFYAIFSDSAMCSIDQGTLICDDFTSKRIGSKCPNDYIFILGERNGFVDALVPVRSSAYLNIASINTADSEFVVLHEFGHLFGRLVDEYTDDTSYKGLTLKNAPNCDNDSCNKWSDFNNTQCLKGCSLSNYYRSKDYTIMRNYFKSKTFGVYNEWLLNKSLQH
jgi:hypothetical protein